MIFSKAITRIRNETILTLQSTDYWNISPTSSGMTVNESTAMKLSTVARCVNVLSDSISKLPFEVKNSNRETINNHPINYLLKVRPNDRMTPSVFKKLIEVHRQLWGNAYVYIQTDGNGRPIALIPLPPDSVLPYIDQSNNLWYIVALQLSNGTYEMRKLQWTEILHLKNYTIDGITGRSTLQMAAETIGTDQASQQYEGKFYKQGARPSGIVEVPTKIEKEGKEKIRSEFETMYSGLDNSFRVAVLDVGMKYTQLSLPQKDAQFIESRNFKVEEIARFFGVPLYKLQAGKQSYSSNEQNSIDYVTGTLHPIVKQYEEELTYKLLFDTEIKRGLYININMTAELRGDNASRSDYYQKMIQNGIYSPNECRELEDMPPIPGGDIHFASLNYVPLSRFEELSLNRNQPAGGGGS